MSVDQKPTIARARAQTPPGPPRDDRRGFLWRRRRPRRRLRKLRILLIVISFAALALISAVFGALMSVASDLPQLKVTRVHESYYSTLYDDTGEPIGALAPPSSPGPDTFKQISWAMRRAIVSVEDRRFWTDPGFDVKGLIRAAASDITGGQREGGSTIAEQFVKVTEQEQDHRTVFEKLREAALAFQLVHRWPRWQILADYLNRIYFGNGANGIEAAARIYFGKQLGYDPNDPAQARCGDPSAQDPKLPKCASLLAPYQAALLAGMVANPTQFDPVLNPQAARARRDQVLGDMVEQSYIPRSYYQEYANYPVPTADQIEQPSEPAAAPYFTAWVRPQIVTALENEGVAANLADYEAYYGGLKIRLTINLAMQQAAQETVDSAFDGLADPPTATLVSIDNHTGEVRAMVQSNADFQQDPFNLAVDGERQPGSSFKLFTLAAALSSGAYAPYSLIDSHPLEVPYIDSIGKREIFPVRNFGNNYSGLISLATATAISDNTVFVQVGMSVGTHRIRRYAQELGIRTPVSTNPAMIIGGLTTGVSALDMAHAYETAATGGLKVWNPTLGDASGSTACKTWCAQGPIGIHSIEGCQPCHTPDIVNQPTYTRVLSPDVASEIQELLEGVVSPGGTGTEAAIPGVVVAGKTGTTSNYVDAWFVGWTPQLTTAVWVGYPRGAVPMATLWDGGPVEGGTYPAVIWRTFMTSALQILAEQSAASKTSTVTIPQLSVSTSPVSSTPTSTTTTPTTATTPTTPASAATTTTPSGATGGARAGGATGTGAAGGTAGGATGTGAASGTGAGTAGGAGQGGSTGSSGAGAGGTASGSAGGSAGGGSAGGTASGSAGGSAGGGSAGGTAGSGASGSGSASGATGGAGLGGGWCPGPGRRLVH